MRFMNRTYWSMLVLAGMLVAPIRVIAQTEGASENADLGNAQMVQKLLSSRVRQLRTSAGPDPDTVYVGKSYVNHTAPDNYWNVYTGTYLPGTNAPNNAIWDFDNMVGIQAPDSLQGWWPMHRQYNSTGGLTLTDDQRPWWCIDHGNIGNYVLSQQSSAKRT